MRRSSSAHVVSGSGQVGLDLTLDEAIAIVHDWIGQIARA